MSTYILPFSSDQNTTATAGGKGANLAALTQAQFPVPAGFIITTQAYRDFVAANRIQPPLLALVQDAAAPCAAAQSADAQGAGAIEQAALQIARLFQQADMPPAVADEICAAYRAHFPADPGSAPRGLPVAAPPVAVRSSANAEDLPGFAFAGQQDTFLNVRGETALLEAVKKCWASLWTARAITYRARGGFAPEGVALAVVVQALVPAQVAGVLFTADPLTGRRAEIHIDASYGLGEAIVSGQVEPDHYIVDPAKWRITARQLGGKQVAVQPADAGGTQRVERPHSAEQALPDAAILELAQLGRQVGLHFGEPQDIEWAWAGGRFWLLQSRPITSLYPLPDTALPDGPLQIFINFNAIQGVNDPLTPLGIDALRLLFGGVLRIFGIRRAPERVFPAAGGRLFLDFGDLPGDPLLRNFVLNFLETTEPAARQTLLKLFAAGRVPLRRVLGPGRAARLLVTLAPLLTATLAGLVRYQSVRRRVTLQAEDYIQQVKDHLVAAPDLAARLQAMQDDLPQAERISVQAMPLALAANNLAPLIDRWLAAWLGEKPGAGMAFLRSLPGNVTVEMTLSLWAAAQAIRQDGPSAAALRDQPVETLVEQYRQGRLPAAAQHAIAGFLQSYGMRGTAEIDLGKPRWAEDPTPILHMLYGYLRQTDPRLSPDAVYRQGAEQAERLILEYAARIRRTRFGWLRERLFIGVVRRMRALAALREIPLFTLARVLSLYRAALLDSAETLVQQQALQHSEDIFFVPLPDLRRFGQGEKIDLQARVDLQTIATAQRGLYERERLRKQMPRVLLNTGEAFYEGVGEGVGEAAAAGSPALPQPGAQRLAGQSVSPGVAEGRARVILDPHGARLEPGEILVCPSTDPGWTPLFLTAAGLVMEIGGLMTHGSIVAREYGIPAVVGVRDATTRIHTGQKIRIDGSTGAVTVIG